ncbi:MAG: hypothetical protein M5U09_27990, partial [Gammaproteobacteria bacterium]|nr:hypothetical protein [Gammaproteobacteria bacterium]
ASFDLCLSWRLFPPALIALLFQGGTIDSSDRTDKTHALRQLTSMTKPTELTEPLRERTASLTEPTELT